MADDSDITLNGKLLSELRVVDLKRELEQRGLSKGGSKTQLTDRLRAQLRLEKLHSEAQAASSGDEAKAPNLALQDDEVTGKNDFIKQYLLQQQRNLERQREIKKKVEEERKRQSAEESADESQQSIAEEENKSKEVTSEAEVKAATDAPAGVSTSDLEMAKSRSRHYRSKEKNEAAQKREVVESTNEKGDADSTEPEVKKSKQTRSPSPRESGHHKRHRSGSSSRSRSRSPERFQSTKGHKGGHKHGRGRSSRKESRSSSRSPSPKTSSRGKAETQRVSRPRNTSRPSRSKSKSPDDIAEKTLIRRSSRRSAQAARASNSQQQNVEESGRREQEPLEVREGTVEDKTISFSSPDAKETSPKELPSSSSQVPLIEKLAEHSQPTKREGQEIASEEGVQKSLTEVGKSVELEKETRLRQTKKTEASSEESEVVVPKPKRGSRWSRSSSDLKPVESDVAPSEAAGKPDTFKRALVSSDETSEQLVPKKREENSVVCEETVVNFQLSEQTDLLKEGSTGERADSDSKEQKLSKISGRDRKSLSKDELKESSEQTEKTLGDISGDKADKKLQEEEFIRKAGSSEQQVTSGRDFIDRQPDVGEEQAAKEDTEVPSSTKTDYTKEKVDKLIEKNKEVASDACEDSRPTESRQKRIWRSRSKEEGAKRGEQEKFPEVHLKGVSSNLEEEKDDTENSEQSLHKFKNQKEEDMPQERQGDSNDVAEMSEVPNDNVESGTNPAAQLVSHEITEKLPANQKSEENSKGIKNEQQSDTSQNAEYEGTKNMLGTVSQSIRKEPNINETTVLEDKQPQPSQSEDSPSRSRSTSRSPAPREKSRGQKRKDSSSSASSRSRSQSRSVSRKNRSSSSSSRSSSSKSESSDTEEEEPRSMKSTASKRSPRKSVSRSPSPSTNEAKGGRKSAAVKHEGSAEATKKKRETMGENSSSKSPPRKLARASGTSDTDEIGKDVGNDIKGAAKIGHTNETHLGPAG
ncbi:serine/arginine repetitive matrix protein 2-like isoform X3 [Pomacea canaliculata]|uniref:serine/arginine repetitive matrix protein 2-like isoform X3 n=1 Tax=Pomacea canaliculata TaxID=400727 RepID=UPI000D737DCC|nr:serine/arginine repetitive matrix protein 2-like isoform X3 [Pomacea canaliculata]